MMVPSLHCYQLLMQAKKKTAKFCFQHASEIIENLKSNMDIEVIAIVNDNENKMVKMKKLLSEKYPKIISYGCSVHYLNLLESEVTPGLVIKHIIEVQKFFRNKHQAHVRTNFFFIIFPIISLKGVMY